MAREVKTNFTADTSDLERGARAAGDAIDDAESSSRNWGRAAGVAAVGIGAAAVVAWDFAEAAAAEERSATQLATTLRNVTRATDGQVSSAEDWVEATQSQTGILDDDLRSALNQAVLATGDLSTAQDLVSTAMDVSAGTGRDLGAVIEAIAAQQRGETDALQSMGLATNDATGELLDMNTVLANASDMFGGQMSASLDTAQGRLQVAQANFAEMKEELGARLLPILTDVAQFIVSDVIPALSAASQWVEENWPKIRDTAQEVWAGFTLVAQEAWDRIGPIVTGIYDAIAGFVGLVKNIFEGDWSEAWDSAVRMVSGAWDAIRGLLDVIGEAVAAMGQAAKGVLIAAGEGIVDWFQELGSDIIEAIGRGIAGASGLATDFATDFANTIIRFVNTQLIDRINDAVEFTVDPPGPGSFTFDPPDIPRIPALAAGGLVTGPTLALVGESGPELVVPLPQVGDVLGGRSSGGSVTIPGSGYISATDLRVSMEEMVRLGMLDATVLVAA